MPKLSALASPPARHRGLTYIDAAHTRRVPTRNRFIFSCIPSRAAVRKPLSQRGGSIESYEEDKVTSGWLLPVACTAWALLPAQLSQHPHSCGGKPHPANNFPHLQGLEALSWIGGNTMTPAPSTKRRSILCLLVVAWFAIPFASAQASPDHAVCQARVLANEVIVSNHERVETGFHVLPPGVVPAPGEWPYFAWSDTSLGVVRTRDGGGYLFFGSDGGCHKDCATTTPRWGSVTLSQGSLDHPLGEPLGDPIPPVYEFVFPNTKDIPKIIDYAGGGPVYRVPGGEPGAGDLLLVYHTEQPANPFYSRTGIAKSTDEGLTWHDLGTTLTVPHPYDPTGATDVGENPLVPYTDPATREKFFYIFFPSTAGPPPPNAATSRTFPWPELLTKRFCSRLQRENRCPPCFISTTRVSGTSPA